jgi:TonB family protein
MSLCLAGLMLAAATSFATAAELQPLPGPAKAEAQRLLTDAGVDTQGQTVTVRAAIDPDGKVTGVKVLKSSGSRRTDRIVGAVLQAVVRAYPPLGLTDGAVTMQVGDSLQASR